MTKQYVRVEGVNRLLLSLITIMVITICNSETIDEIISKAAKSLSEEQASDNLVVLDYDMVFNKQQYEDMEKISLSRRKRRKAWRDRRWRWVDCIIPYDISNAFSSTEQAVIMKSINEWEQNTCLLFRPTQSEDRHFITFQPGPGCNSFVGEYNMPGPQILHLGLECRTKRVIMHLIGHSIGFTHEHNRPDRDQFVRIRWQNVADPHSKYFLKWHRLFVDSMGVPYDYKSIMHYGKRFLSKNNQWTIETVDRTMQNVIGQATRLSFYDIMLANLMYNCSVNCKDPPTCPSNSFLSKDCQCLCPGNPTKICDNGNMQWKPWQQWGDCSVTCGSDGKQQRLRSCATEKCVGSSTETRLCQEEPCFDTWLKWSPWKGCSITCGGGGTQGRHRNCSGSFCVGPATENRTCNEEPCDDGGHIGWGPWQNWNRCSITCGSDGTQERRRSCETGNCVGASMETRFCKEKPCIDIWLSWSNWGPCSETCIQKRQRSCSDSFCAGPSTEIRACKEPCHACTSHALATLSGTFSSPNYPDMYPQDSCSRWTIQVASGLIITLLFEVFRLEPCIDGITSIYDFLDVYDGTTESSPRLAHLCGTKVPPPVIASGNVMLVTFKSDENVQETGFNATYEAVDALILMSCDFETPCSRLKVIKDSDDFNWDRIRCCTPSDGTGPVGDHTLGNKMGHFMYTEATDTSSKAVSWMKTEPAFRHKSSHVCVHFWYHMKGINMGSLSIFYMEEGQSDNRIWTVTGDQGDVWKEKHLTIPTKANQNFEIALVATRGSDFLNDISVDDITISSEPCNMVWTLWSRCSVTCGNGVRQRSMVCHRNQKCPGAVTVTEMCMEHICSARVLLRCDFETPCKYLKVVPNRDTFDWKRQVCCTQSENTGPSVDHTTGTETGWFMYAEASDMYENDMAHLHTDPALRNTNTQACLKFWYHMKGARIGSLEILLKKTATSIWRRSGNQGDQWHEAVVTVTTPVEQDFHLVFRASRGADFATDIAIDDVTITAGRCVSESK